MLSLSPMYRRMTALLGAHFCADFFSGIPAGFLPVLLTHFDLDLRSGAFLLTCLGLGSNFLQVPAAKIALRRSGPGALTFGLALCGAIPLVVLLPRTTPLWALCLAMLFAGFGIALVHPQGLRGVQDLKSIPARVSTPVFMIGGFLGFALSPFVGGLLVQLFGLRGVLWTLLLPAAVIAAVIMSGVRLAVERPGRTAGAEAAQEEGPCRWSFARIWFMAFFLNTGTLTISSLLPTMLHQRGFSLGFGGFSAMLFGLGSAAGSLLLGYVGKKFRPERLIVAGLCAGIPFFCMYLALASYRAALVPLFLAGLCAAAGFPQMVALIRTVKSRLALSTRNGLLVGGTWGLGAVCFIGMGALAERCGTATAMAAGAALYLLTLLLGIVPGAKRMR